MGDLQGSDSRRANDIRRTAQRLDRVRRAGLGAGLGVIGGVRSAAYLGRGGRNNFYGGGGFYNPWGFGFCNNGYNFQFGFNWWWGDCWWYWPSYVSCYYPYWFVRHRPFYYGFGFFPTVYSSVVYRTVYQDVIEPAPVQEPLPVIEEPAPEPNGNGLFPRPDDTLSIAAERYLTLGDRAFRESRWSDAVQLYAKAVELAPNNAGLYLVLADALFAAGDYHYAAYAVRKAVELDPALLSVPIDKHGFYADPTEFDRQLARLETFVIERPTDRDARLVLAVNLLFGGRPAAAVDLYAAGVAPQAALAQDEAVRLTLESARAAQFGEPVR